MHFVIKGLLAVCSAVAVCQAGAQTIGEFSRSQRAVIEADIARNNAKALGGVGVSVPAGLPPLPSGAATSLPSPLPSLGERGAGAGLAVPSMPLPFGSGHAPFRAAADEGTRTAWDVTGVFMSASRQVAEVVVEGVPYLLVVGDEIPGTSWRIDVVAAHKVIVVSSSARSGAAGRANQKKPASRVFLLGGGG
ncbi:MAG: hypothetical protein RLZZ618_3885 [Pseudomonadota bacterium]|jgi:hypothetical protein